jgi:chromatin remodeling complex protein RSC6
MAKSKQDRTPPTPAGKPTTSRRKSSTPAEAPQLAAAPPRGRGGLAQRVTPSPALGAIVGQEPLSRAKLTQRMWEYIKRHDLQDAQDRRQINADAPLKKVLGKAQVSMFELTKLINQQVK